MEKVIKKVILSVLAILFLLPVLLTVVCSFSAGNVDTDAFRLEHLFPSGLDFTGYYDLLIEHSYVLRNFWNSVFYAGAITCFNILVSVPAAYAFSQARFRGKELLFFFYIVLTMMPDRKSTRLNSSH